MKCSCCESETIVMNSRKVEGGVRRRRKCENGHKFFTIERAETDEYQEEITRLHGDIDSLHQLVGQLTHELNKAKGELQCKNLSSS